LDEEASEVLRNTRKEKSYRSGETVYQQHEPSDGIYCVQEGLLLLTQIDVTGSIIGLRLVTAGETLGFRSYFADEPHAATATALEKSKVCLIPAQSFAALIENNPALSRRFLKTLARDKGPADASLLRSPHYPARLRLVHLLIILKRYMRENEETGQLSLDLPLKRTHISWLIDVRAETLSRTIREVEDLGLAKFNGSTVVIDDYEVLTGYADQETKAGLKSKS
jgi:CRP/FNR family transcriptional regulator